MKHLNNTMNSPDLSSCWTNFDRDTTKASTQRLASYLWKGMLTLTALLFLALMPTELQANCNPITTGGIVPTTVAGNPDACSVCGTGGFKLDFTPTTGTYFFTMGPSQIFTSCSNGPSAPMIAGAGVKLTVTGNTFSWEVIGNITINTIIVKGGPNANVYNYNGQSSDGNLHPPINNQQNCTFFGISHIEFCYSEQVAPPCPDVPVTLRTTNWTTSSSNPGTPQGTTVVPKICVPSFSSDECLVGAELCILGKIQGRARYESLDASPATITLNLQASLNIFLNGQNICSLSPSRVVTDQATIFDGTIDFGGGSGGDFPNLEGQSSCVILVDNPVQLAGFIGGMQTCIDALAIGTSVGTGAGNLITQFNTEAGVGIEATFFSFKATGTPFPPTCAGGTNGGVNLTVTNNFNGMAANFSYEWKNSSNQIVGTSKDLSGVGAGTYTVKVTYTNPTTGNANSCTYTFGITDPTPVTCTTSNIVHVKCFGESTGSFKVNASGGAGGYMYSKDGGTTFQASNEFKNLPAGTYTVVVKDMNGCLTQTPCTAQINEPTALGCNFVKKKDVDCFGGSNGSLEVTGTGGTSPYKYKIQGASGGFLNNGGVFTGLTAGEYTIEIEDKNGCKTACAKITINQPMDISAMVGSTKAACEGVNTGTITVSSVSGGTPGYTYSIDGNNFQANATFTNVAGGNYTVTVKDSKGCTKTFPVSVGFNTLIDFTLSATKETCGNDGTITVNNVSGGSGGYTYALDNNPFGASSTFTGLKAGDYTVKVMDSQGCMTSKMIKVERVPALSCSLQKTDVSCRGGNDGSITVTGNGGKMPYMYKLGNGSFGASNTFNGLTAGEYTVTIKDDNGCESTCTIMVGQPAQDLSCSTSVKDVKCNGDATGEITVTATGGNGGYQYKLGNGNFQGSNKFSGLIAGDYIITVKDSKGCETTCNAKINQPDAITCNSVAQTTSCAGGGDGKITATVMGGVSPYMYKLVRVSDGIVVRSFQTSNEFLNLPAGQYDVVVKDANGCETSCDPIIGIEVPEPAPIICQATPTDATCKGFSDGRITATVISGGLPPYTYKLGNGMFQTSGTFNNLTAGMYTITVKDDKGCESTCMAEVKEPALLTFSTQVDCERQGEGEVAVILNIMGGTPPYRYQVNAGTVFNVPNDNAIFLELDKKSTVKIFDKNNCSEQKDVTPVCCSFAAECKLSSTEQQVEGCNVSAVPAAFTKSSDVFKNITEIPCGTLRMFHNDMTSGTLCGGGILVTRTYTLYDDANNNTQLDNNEESATCVQKFRVKDTTKPSVSGTLTGCFKTEQEAKDAAIAATTAMDACDPNPMKSATVTSQGNCMFKVKVTATDACGNSESIEYTVKIDGEAPNFTVPADTEVNRNNQCSYDASPSVTGNPTNITDNCDANLMATYNDEIQPNGDNCQLVIKRTWKVQDNCGNKTEKVQTITVKDNTPPTATKGTIASCYPTKEAAEAAAIAATSASDNCSANPKKTATTSGTCTAQITVTVEDDCGKKSSVTYDTRIDNTKPMATKGTIASCYATKSEAEAAAKAATTWTDNCSSSQYLEGQETASTEGDCAAVITVKTKDECGNEQSVTYNTRIDDTKPTFDVPAPMTLFRDDQCQYDADPTITGRPTNVRDNCDENPEVSYSDKEAVGSCADELIITRTWEVKDVCGNSEKKTQTITVKDNIKPTFDVPADKTIFTDQNCAYNADPSNTGRPTNVKDNCDPNPVVTYDDVEREGSCAGERIITRTWKVTDRCGNSTTKDQIITVRDIIKPNFNQQIQSSVKLFTSQGANCANTSYLLPGPPDLIGIKKGDVITGTTPVTYFVHGLPFQTPNGNATDNCTPASDLKLIVEEAAEDPRANGIWGMCTRIYIVKFRLEDDCGNFRRTTIEYVVTDDIAPEFVVEPQDKHITVTTIRQIEAQLVAWYSTYAGSQIDDNCTMPSPSFRLLNTTVNGNEYCYFYEFGAMDKCGLVTTRKAKFCATVTGNTTGSTGGTSNGSRAEKQTQQTTAPLKAPAVTTTPSVKLYPNPTQHEVNLDLSDYLGKAVNIRILNSLGQSVQELRNLDVQQTVQRIELNNYRSGIYLITIQTDGFEQVTQKFIVE